MLHFERDHDHPCGGAARRSRRPVGPCSLERVLSNCRLDARPHRATHLLRRPSRRGCRSSFHPWVRLPAPFPGRLDTRVSPHPRSGGAATRPPRRLESRLGDLRARSAPSRTHNESFLRLADATPASLPSDLTLRFVSAPRSRPHGRSALASGRDLRGSQPAGRTSAWSGASGRLHSPSPLFAGRCDRPTCGRAGDDPHAFTRMVASDELGHRSYPGCSPVAPRLFTATGLLRVQSGRWCLNPGPEPLSYVCGRR